MGGRTLPEMAPILIGSILIFFARICDVSIGTMRIILLVRGRRFTAACLGFMESLIYIIALGFLFTHLEEPLSIVMYALGFATGNIIGSTIEEKMAMGYTTVQVISMTHPHELCDFLREQGYGLTVWEGEGREGRRLILNIALKRKQLKGLLKLIDEWDGKAFVTILDTKATKGGILSVQKAK